MDNIAALYAGAPPVTVRDAEPARGCRRFDAQRVLITGAARGIGFASAVRLAAEGARVWITDRDEAALQQAVQAAAAVGLTLHTRVLDSLDLPAIKAGVAQVVTEAGAIDILINNAGGSLHTPFRFLEEDDGHWQQVMQLNVMAAVAASRGVLPAMVAQGHGRIINYGSKAGRFGSLIAGANYAAAKGAMAAMTRQMAREFGPHGITVNCLCPGVVVTDRTRAMWAERRSAEEQAQVLRDIPLRRYAEVEDVAAAVAFLASPDASFVTGVTLDVNGGQAMA